MQNAHRLEWQARLRDFDFQRLNRSVEIVDDVEEVHGIEDQAAGLLQVADGEVHGVDALHGVNEVFGSDLAIFIIIGWNPRRALLNLHQILFTWIDLLACEDDAVLAVVVRDLHAAQVVVKEGAKQISECRQIHAEADNCHALRQFDEKCVEELLVNVGADLEALRLCSDVLQALLGQLNLCLLPKVHGDGLDEADEVFDLFWFEGAGEGDIFGEQLREVPAPFFLGLLRLPAHS